MAAVLHATSIAADEVLLLLGFTHGPISGPTAVEISQELDLDEALLRKRA